MSRTRVVYGSGNVIVRRARRTLPGRVAKSKMLLRQTLVGIISGTMRRSPMSSPLCVSTSNRNSRLGIYVASYNYNFSRRTLGRTGRHFCVTSRDENSRLRCKVNLCVISIVVGRREKRLLLDGSTRAGNTEIAVQLPQWKGSSYIIPLSCLRTVFNVIIPSSA